MSRWGGDLPVRSPVWIGQCVSCYRFDARPVVPKRIAMRIGPHCGYCVNGHLQAHPNQHAALAAYMLGGVDAVAALDGNLYLDGDHA